MPSSFHTAGDGPEFTPPPQPGMLRAFGIAVLAHLLLLLALTWGLQWKRDSQDMAAEAELWSSVPQQAAPKEVPQPPPPPPPPVEKVQPKPEPVNRDAEIALEQEKKRKAAEDERERREAQEREKRKKLEAQRKKEEELKKQEQTRLAAENRKKEEEEKKRKEKQKEAEQAKKLAQMREENLRRIQGMAGGTSSNEQGRAAQSSGPSASWAGRVRARVKPNIVFTDDVSGNPAAEVDVRLSPDGTIVSRRISKSSGIKAWDEAVLRALDKTEVLPRDTDGSVPRSGTLIFKPKDF